MKRTEPVADLRDTRSPDLIREDIARTRAELGRTVEALSARADVKTRAREAARETVGHARKRAAGLARPVVGAVAGAAVAAGVLALFLMLRRRRRGW